LYSHISNKAYFQVLNYLIENIKTNNIKKGSKLRTERELSELLGVSRASIREAIKILDIIGLVEKKPKSGTYVRKEFEEWYVEPISIMFKLSGVSQKDVYEFRKMIEVEVATLAAEKINDEEIEELKKCFSKMIYSDNEFERVIYDKKFHYILVKASRNSIILNSYNAMAPMLDIFTTDIRTVVIDKEGEEAVKKLHENIFYAVVDRNVEKAKEAMKVHMDMINKYFE
jgi:GntR family transcriptional repressor for pyruvate dehydrogenase complex